jgi:hypothetical protein
MASIIRMTKIGELGTTLTITSTRSALRRNFAAAFFIGTAVKSSNLTDIFVASDRFFDDYVQR